MFKLIVLTFAALPMMSSSLQRKLLGDAEERYQRKMDYQRARNIAPVLAGAVAASVAKAAKERAEEEYGVQLIPETPGSIAERKERALEWAKNVEDAARAAKAAKERADAKEDIHICKPGDTFSTANVMAQLTARNPEPAPRAGNPTQPQAQVKEESQAQRWARRVEAMANRANEVPESG